MSSLDKLNKIKYSGKDFDSIYDDILQRVKDRFGDTVDNLSPTDPIGLFIDIPSYALSSLSWYLDRYANETYLDTCKLRSSAARIVRHLGYKPSQATPASTALTVSLQEAYAFDVTIPDGFQFLAKNGTIYETSQSTTWSAADISDKSLNVYEGETRHAIYVSSGEPNQRFKIASTSLNETYLVGQSMDVVIEGDTWSEVDILKAEQSNQYEIEYDEDPPNLRFGDGIAGNKPPEDSEIRVSYRICHGNKGIVSSAQIDSSVVPLIINGTTIKLTIVQSIASTGGDGPESLESIKSNAPNYYMSRGVAVTESDYIGLSYAFSDPQYGRPSVVTAINTRNAESDIELNVLLDKLKIYTDLVQSSVNEKSTNILASKTNISSYKTNINSSNNTVIAESDSILTSSGNISTNVLTLNSLSSSLGVKLDTIEQKNTDISSDADEILADGTISVATSTLATDISALSSEINSLIIIVKGLITNIQSAVDALSTENISIDSHSSNLTDETATITTNITSMNAELTNIAIYLSTINSDMSQYNDDIAATTVDILAHADDHFTSNTDANVVTIPVLVKDSDGFYAAPSNGLLKAMSSYFEDKKDVTHTVDVVSGDSMLVSVAVTVTVKVIKNYVVSSILTQLEAEINLLLKDRIFGDGLRLQEVYDLKDKIKGIDYLNVSFLPTGYLDSYGNIVIGNSQMITKDTVEVSEVS